MFGLFFILYDLSRDFQLAGLLLLIIRDGWPKILIIPLLLWRDCYLTVNLLTLCMHSFVSGMNKYE
ncbi:hypothetical protein NS389_04410 [Pantoea dispersa]|nr:hypothetical protein NS389_04410 [Pantoea dispersa]KTS61561.1 hypothetical protein NS380_03115 [Pantoea dispersa]